MNHESYTPYDATLYPVSLRLPEANDESRLPDEARTEDFVLVGSSDQKWEADRELERFSAELLAKLDHAAAIATDNHHLNGAERALLTEIEERLGATRKDLIRRNFYLLALHRGGLWRENYESLADFAKSHAGLSSSQLRKVLDETELVELFLRRGLHHIRPQGDNAQLLLKVTDHRSRIEAWEYARKVCAEEGLSRDGVRDALRDFCRERQITFGRRKESQRELERRTGKSSPPALPLSASVAASPKTPTFLLQIVRPSTLANIEEVYSRKDPCQVLMESLKEAFPGDSGNESARAVEQLMAWLQENDRSTHHQMIAWAFSEISKEIDRCARERCKANADEKARLHKKKAAQEGSGLES